MQVLRFFGVPGMACILVVKVRFASISSQPLTDSQRQGFIRKGWSERSRRQNLDSRNTNHIRPVW